MPSKPTPPAAAKRPIKPRAAPHKAKTPAPAPVSPEVGDALEKAEAQTRQLIGRIAMMEAEQKAARERIEQLTQAKISFEHAISRIKAQKEASVQQQTNNERLLHELAEMVERKETEQQELKGKVETIRVQAEKEISLLKAERDAALAIAQRREPLSPWQMFVRRHINLVIIAGSFVLVFIMLLLVALIKLLF